MDNNLNELSLFAGIGGLSLGLKMADSRIRTVAYCEIDRYCQGVLLSRMSEGKLDNAPIWDDIRTLKGEFIKERIDIISGGFPCQDLSVAGKRAGIIEGNRSGLWFEYLRLICEIRPRFVFVENVSGLLMGGLGIVLGNLAKAGYNAKWLSIRASDVGANHHRLRVFLLAYTESTGTRGKRGIYSSRKASPDSLRTCFRDELEYSSQDFPDSSCSNEENLFKEWRPQIQPRRSYSRGNDNSRNWEVEPDVGRVAHGVAYAMERLKSLGNGVVPQQAAKAWEILSQGIVL